MSVQLEILEDPARACAALMVSAASGGGHIVLTGGSTPRQAYESFAETVRSVGVDVGRTHFWFGDERCVPPSDERSNFRLARESLLDPLGLSEGPHVHRMRGELGPHAGAEDYARQLTEAGEPEFDLLLLGLGPDGHVASLFPDQDTLSVRDRDVVGVPEAGLEPFVPRVSLTLPRLGRAAHVVFLVSGESKADAVASCFGPSARPDSHFPGSLVPNVAERITVLLDPAAAAGL